MRWQISEAGITQDQAIVDIPNVADEKVVVGENRFEVNGPDLFADGDNHEAQGRRQRTSHWTASKLTNTSVAQAESLHLQCRGKQGRDVLDGDFPCDVQATEGSSLNGVARIVEATRVNREYLIVADIHVGSSKIQEHVPGAKKPLLIDAGKESSQVLVAHLKMAMFRSLS